MNSANKLSPSEVERLAFLSEELGEAQQIIGKILRHGYQNYHPDAPKITNRTLLAKELGHVWAAIQMLVIKNDISGLILEYRRGEKHHNVKQWMHHQAN